MIKGGGKTALEAYQNDAKLFHVVIGQGSIGVRIDELFKRNVAPEIFWAMAVYSSKWAGAAEGVIAPLRGVALGSPGLAMSGFVDAAHRAED